MGKPLTPNDFRLLQSFVDMGDRIGYYTGQLPTEADAVKLVEISDYIGEAAISMAARTEFEDPRS
ncbi:hypothetical protein FHX05_005931 [Rhizobium sp. BK491]|nr:hypothetical protein [Rhizobium sp. BK491]